MLISSYQVQQITGLDWPTMKHLIVKKKFPLPVKDKLGNICWWKDEIEAYASVQEKMMKKVWVVMEYWMHDSPTILKIFSNEESAIDFVTRYVIVSKAQHLERVLWELNE